MSQSSKFAKKAKMDLVHIDAIINSGLPHVAEEIFKSLSDDDLIQCLKVSKTWKGFAEKVLLQKWSGKLSEACCAGKTEILRLLLDNGDDTALNATDEKGWTPFSLACLYRHQGVAELLFDHPGFEVDCADKYGKTNLMWASEMGSNKIVQRLLTIMNITDINKKDQDGNTALMLAIQSKNESVANQLLNLEGIEVESGNEYGSTCLMWASLINLDQIVIKLLPKLSPGSIKKRNCDGWNAFMYACCHNSDKVLELMFAKSPMINWDFNAKTNFGYTGFILACMKQHEKAVDLILANYQRLKIDLKIKDYNGKNYWPEKFEGITIEDYN